MLLFSSLTSCCPAWLPSAAWGSEMHLLARMQKQIGGEHQEPLPLILEMGRRRGEPGMGRACFLTPALGILQVRIWCDEELRMFAQGWAKDGAAGWVLR